MDEVIGRTITAIHLNEDNTLLRFDTDQGPLFWSAEGDCCSESWIEEINHVESLIGNTVEAVKEMDQAEAEGTRQDWDVIYGYQLTTRGGHSLIAFRNSSNGYYGGSLDSIAAAEIKEWYGNPVTWRPITEDFKA
jgi:hypothetical protein